MTGKVPTRVVVVENEPLIAHSLARRLEGIGIEVVGVFGRGEDAVKFIDAAKEEEPDAVLLDIRLAGELDGMAAARQIAARHRCALIFLTGHADRGLFEQALELKPHTYLLKLVPDGEELRRTIELAVARRGADAAGSRSGGEASPTLGPAFRASPSFPVDNAGELGIPNRMVGVSEHVKALRREIAMLAPSSLPVTILGDTGCGKEVVARELHRLSKRPAQSFLAINCATLGNLADTELFGQVRGAFTGSVRGTLGYIGSADGGTLFLDEIETLPASVQPKLLRFLDSGEYLRVGEATPKRADVRIIAASNRDLEEMCDQGAFRRDLFYRISGATLRLTPLNHRREDIPPLVEHFIRCFEAEGMSRVYFTDEAMAALCCRDWPGNVRQLKQLVHQLMAKKGGALLGKDEIIRLAGDNSAATPAMPPSYQKAKEEAMRHFGRNYFTKLLSACHGDAAKAMAVAGMHKKNFYDKLRELGLSPKDFRPSSRLAAKKKKT